MHESRPRLTPSQREIGIYEDKLHTESKISIACQVFTALRYRLGILRDGRPSTTHTHKFAPAASCGEEKHVTKSRWEVNVCSKAGEFKSDVIKLLFSVVLKVVVQQPITIVVRAHSKVRLTVKAAHRAREAKQQ